MTFQEAKALKVEDHVTYDGLSGPVHGIIVALHPPDGFIIQWDDTTSISYVTYDSEVLTFIEREENQNDSNFSN